MPLPDVGLVEFRIPILSFVATDYWGRYYVERPWYRDRDRWFSYRIRSRQGWHAPPPGPRRPGWWRSGYHAPSGMRPPPDRGWRRPVHHGPRNLRDGRNERGEDRRDRGRRDERGDRYERGDGERSDRGQGRDERDDRGQVRRGERGDDRGQNNFREERGRGERGERGPDSREEGGDRAEVPRGDTNGKERQGVAHRTAANAHMRAEKRAAIVDLVRGAAEEMTGAIVDVISRRPPSTATLGRVHR